MEFLEEGRLELYNLRTDVGETKNLAQTEPAKAKELHGKLVAWREAIKAPMPEKNDGQQPTVKKKPGQKGEGKKKRQQSEAK
jgi:hypothetical protein